MATKKTTKKKELKSWSDISGEMRVWGREFTYKKSTFMFYSTSVGSKNEDEEYDNVYYNVRFKKDESPDIEGAFKINVKKGFLTVSTDKDGDTYPSVMILDYDIIDDE